MDWEGLAFLIGNLVGWVIKHKTSVPNKVIPIIVFAVQLLVRFSAGLVSAPAALVVQAGFLSSLNIVGQVLINSMGSAVLDAAKAVLLHSTSRAMQELYRLKFRLPYVPGPPTAKY